MRAAPTSAARRSSSTPSRRSGLLAKTGDTYALTPLSQTFLRSSERTYVGGLSRIFASRHIGPHLDTMTEAVKKGGVVRDTHAETPEHPFWTDFAEGSTAMAGPAGGVLSGLIGPWLSARPDASVLDVACGSGLYGFSVAAACEAVRVVSQDWPSVLEKTRGIAAKMGVDSRVDYLPGDLFEVELGGPYDLVIASHVFHHFDPATNQRLLAKLAGATKPDGKVVIHEFVSGEATPADDPAPHLFSAMMLSWTRHGQAYSRDHYTAWLAEAGFGEPEVHASAGAPTKFLVATRGG